MALTLAASAASFRHLQRPWNLSGPGQTLLEGLVILDELASPLDIIVVSQSLDKPHGRGTELPCQQVRRVPHVRVQAHGIGDGLDESTGTRGAGAGHF